jgi:hypothetical protein
MPQGFVAMLDVLGFSSLVIGEHAYTKLHEYKTCLENSLADDHDAGLRFVVFSDSIVLTTHNDDGDSFSAMVRQCSALLGSMLDKNIPIRGAIARGPYVRATLGESVFVAGSAILDAYSFEKKQDWVGIMLAPSAVGALPNLADRCQLPGDPQDREQLQALRDRISYASFMQPCYSIPFHGSPPDQNDYDGFAIVPTNGTAEPEKIHDSLSQALKKLDWLKSLAPDPQAQRKYLKSTQWLGPIRYRWQQIAHWTKKYATEGR